MESLLQDKVVLPFVRGDQIIRERLLQKLNNLQLTPLTLISAPAGYGKTTLVMQWLKGLGHPVVWLSVDESDNDPHRFIRYLIAAIEHGLPSLTLPEARFSERAGAIEQREYLTAVLNSLLPQRSPVFLVLDDFHNIHEAAVHQLAEHFLLHLPTAWHAVIATRSDPPIQLSQLRAKGWLQEIRSSDLQFSLDEVAEFMKSASDTTLHQDDIEILRRRTEGWAAGLRMAAISLEKVDSPSEFIEEFAGTNRNILDYLMDEILDRQGQSVREFMLKTGFLDRLSPALCDAVVFPEELPGKSEALLALIHSHNLFLFPVDDKQQWFRYHQLFKDLLQTRLDRIELEERKALIRRAGEWYWARSEGARNVQSMGPALRYLALAGEYATVVQYLENVVDEIVAQSQINHIGEWISYLPEGIITQSAKLCVYEAMYCIMSGRSTHYLENRLEQSEDIDQHDEFGGERALVRAFLYSFQGKLNESLEQARLADTLLPREGLVLRSLLLNHKGMLHMLRGEIDECAQAMYAAVELGRKTGNQLGSIGAMTNVAGLMLSQGKLYSALEMYQHALELATDPQGSPLPVAGKAFMGLAEVLREWNRLQEAEAQIDEALKLMSVFGDVGVIMAQLTKARILFATGRTASAFKILESAQSGAARSDATDLDDILVSLLLIRFLAWQKKVDEAEIALRRLQSSMQEEEGSGHISRVPSFSILQEAIWTTEAVYDLAVKDWESAIEKTEKCIASAARQGQNRRVLEAMILAARAYQGKADSTSAKQHLESALKIAAPQGFKRMFLDAGDSIKPLLQDLVQSSEHTQFIEVLVREMEATTSLKELADPQSSNLVEPLSDRELEILSLLAEGKTNLEIAEAAFIALSTVKWHTSNIYGKLSVRNRVEAIDKARSLGLIA